MYMYIVYMYIMKVMKHNNNDLMKVRVSGRVSLWFLNHQEDCPKQLICTNIRFATFEWEHWSENSRNFLFLSKSHVHK